MAKTSAERMRDLRARQGKVEGPEPMVSASELYRALDRLEQADRIIADLLSLTQKQADALAEAVTKRHVTSHGRGDDRHVTAEFDAAHDAPLGPPARAPAPARQISSLSLSSPVVQTNKNPNPEELADWNGARASASQASRDDVTKSVTIDVTTPVTGVTSRSGRVRPPGPCGHVPEESFAEKKLTPDEEPSGARPVTRAARHANGVGGLKRLGGDERSGEGA